jgi:hypothetical protein
VRTQQARNEVSALQTVDGLERSNRNKLWTGFLTEQTETASPGRHIFCPTTPLALPLVIAFMSPYDRMANFISTTTENFGYNKS